MADETKKLIFEIEFDTEKQVAEAGRLRKAIDDDKQALSELNKQIKLNGDASGELAKQATQFEISIKNNTKARNTELKAVDNYIKATKGAVDANGKYNGSINNLRGNLAFLTEKWNDLSKEERENAQIGGVLQKELKKTSDQLKELEGSVGDNRRSVGGYLDAIRQAPGLFGKMKAGVDGIGLAMSASPIGLFTAALQIIPQLLNSSGEGADFFAKAMSIVNAVIQEGLKRVVALGGAAVKLMSGDFKGAFNDGKAAVSGFSAAVSGAVKAGGELADRLDALEVAESKFSVTNANTRKEIDALLIQARNRTTAEADRIKLYERAEKLEVALNTQALRLAKERLALIQKENAIKQGDEDEEQKRVNEQLVRIKELETESANIQEKIQLRKDQLADAAAAREKKRHEDALKRFDEHKKQLQSDLEMFQKFVDGVKENRDKQLEQEQKERDNFKKVIDQQFANSEKARKAAEKQSADENAQKDADSKKEIDRKKKEHQMLVEFSDASSALFAALAEESSGFAEFQKALTLFKIGLASAEAITKGIAASQDVGFPGNIIAMATTVATVGANLLQAKKLIDGDAPKPPKARAAEGGLLVGPSHASGGITGTGSFANVEVEGGEAIINKRATSMFAPILSMINQMGGGRALASTTYAAAGGYLSPTLPTSTRNYISNTGFPTIDYNQLARAMANMPAPVVSVKRIEAVQAQHQVTVKRATIG